MWTVLRAIHILSLTGFLASLCHKDTNAGTCPLLNHLHVVLIAKYLQMMKLIKWKSNFGCRKIFERTIVGSVLFCVFLSCLWRGSWEVSVRAAHISSFFSPCDICSYWNVKNTTILKHLGSISFLYPLLIIRCLQWPKVFTKHTDFTCHIQLQFKWCWHHAQNMY